MNNLKRVLSTVLAGTMLAGMMVVGASAAGFPDADKIEHTEAVNTLTALNVISGKDDGNFDPEGSLTRAEMAKLAVFVLHGGKDPVLGTKAVPTYTDIKGNWAESYIEYCSATGIINGMGDGTFGPNATLTGSQAAKMLLVAMNYDANVFGLTGADWEINTNVEANKAGLYNELAGMDPSATITRDQAAQLVFNAIQAGTMGKTWNQDANGQISQTYQLNPGVTLLNTKFKATTTYGYVTNVSYDDIKGEYVYTLDDGTTFLGADVIDDSADAPGTLRSTTDYSDLFGMKVKVLSKAQTDGTIILYGMHAVDSKVLVSAAAGNLPTTIDVDAASVKINGTSYKLDGRADATKVYAYNTTGVIDTLNAIADDVNDYDGLALIDNDGDGKANIAIVYPVSVAKVTFVGKDSITAGVSYKFASCDIYEGVAKDDYIVITNKAYTKNDTTVIAKAEVVTGEITAVKSTGEIRVNDTWYSLADVATGDTSATAGDSVVMQVVNGFVARIDVVNAGTALEDVLYVIDADITGSGYGQPIAPSLGNVNKGVDTLILTADGTKTTVKAMRVDTWRSGAGGTTVNAGDTAYIYTAAKKTPSIPAAGLYTYKINDDGVYELKAVKSVSTSYASAATVGGDWMYIAVDANEPGKTTFGSGAAGYVKTTGKLDGKFIADDAVIYLVDTLNSKYKVVSGKELKTMSNYGTSTSYVYKDVSGLATVQVAVVSANAAYSTTDVSTGWGYITSSGYAEKTAAGKWVIKFTAWTTNGTENLTAVDSTLTSSSASAYAAGTFIKFTYTVNEGEITGMTDLLASGVDTNLANGEEVAILGWDGVKNIRFATGNTYTTFKDNDKTVVLYVNTADKTGVEGGEINVAEDLDPEGAHAYVKNAVVMTDSSDGGKVSVLFVDVANKLTGAQYTVTHSTSATTVKGITVDAAATVKVGTTTISSGNYVKAGSTLSVILAGSGTASDDATITVTLTLDDGDTMKKTFAVANGDPFSSTTLTFTMPYQAVTAISVAIA